MRRTTTEATTMKPLTPKMLDSLQKLEQAGPVMYNLPAFKRAGLNAHSIYALENRGMVARTNQRYEITDAGREHLTNLPGTPSTPAVSPDAETLVDAGLAEYAATQLAAGNFLSISSEASRWGDRRITGICGHDPRESRDWLLGLVENRVR